MQRNPYSPPESTVLATPESPRSPRPISAWLLLILLALTELALATGIVREVFLLAPYFRQIPNQWSILLGLGFRLAIAGVILVVLVGIFKRKQWGRWLGLLALALLAATGIFGNDTTVYDNQAQRAGGLLAQFVLTPLLIAWWVYAFGFSAKAKRYFGLPDKVA
ncbi:hypothetical protein ACSFBF_14575 [Variovorax sp. ZT5P49]|uniref:hypothetical protein n=1 Tax=Variovorax sp. ZT5P49 TaxID=3443733 RepID=UPI003F45736A